MSAKLAMRVLDSALDASLKPAAVVMALFGNDQGEKIFPSVDRVAFLLGVTRRSAERSLARLRELGVLLQCSGFKGGRRPGGFGQTVLYRLNVDALPRRSGFEPRRTRHPSSTENPDTDDGVLGRETPTSMTSTPTSVTETPTPVSQNPDAHVGRSFSDRSCMRGNSPRDCG